MPAEHDPTGLAPGEPGAKLDAGKVRAGLLLDFGRALTAVAEVATYGARKYSVRGWLKVPDANDRYLDAQWRHALRGQVETHDPDTGLLHLAHEAWNVLARLELRLRASPPEVLERFRRAHEHPAGAYNSPKGDSFQAHIDRLQQERRWRQDTEETPAAGSQPGSPDVAPERATAEDSATAGKPAAGARYCMACDCRLPTGSLGVFFGEGRILRPDCYGKLRGVCD